MGNLASAMAVDPTLEAIDRALELANRLEQAQSVRGTSLGMGAVGEGCKRKLWYSFRWAAKENFDAATLKRFEDGHMQEALQAERLRMVEGITLITLDPDTGKQIGFKDLENHFRGYCDGEILGIIQAPKTWHIWEHKSVGEKSIAELQRTKIKLGEKKALKEWKPVYYAQAILYMYYTGFTRHYMTISSPGGRDTVSIRTDADTAEALALIAKAKRIIESQEPLDRISKTPDYFECRYCIFTEICHKDKVPTKNCRTCLHSSPVKDGEWACAKFDKLLPVPLQKTGCPSHLFLPGFVPGKVIEVGENFVRYQFDDGSFYTNQGEE